MNKERELILEELKTKKETLQERAPKNIVIQNIKLLGTIQLNEIETEKEQEGGKTAKLYLVEEYNKETDKIMLKYYADDEFIGIANEGEFIPTGLAREKYEDTNSIKDVLEDLKEKEEFEKDNIEEKSPKVYDLNKLEEEKEQEEKNKNKKTREADEKKKRKPSYVIETVNPDVAKMDYWQTLKQACGLPSKVATLAFAYPVSSEDKVDHANITVYMLDKDGNIIDDLDVDDYFEFDSSTGNNPTNDNVLRHEEGKDEGKTQLDDHNTMIRLFAKNSRDRNTYISLEQKNGFGDYNDINAGRKAVGGTQNVEKQLETDRIRVWDSERELLMKSNSGMYHINEMANEAKEHEKHRNEGYIDIKNADGYSDTKVICTKNIYLLHQCLIKVKENDYISEKFSDQEIIKGLIVIIDKDPEITPDELINKYEGDIMGDYEAEHGHNNEVENTKAEDDDEKYANDGPWRNSMRQR